MKKCLLVMAAALLVLAGVMLWYDHDQKSALERPYEVQPLGNIEAYIEQHDLQYAMDRLDYLVTYSYPKELLHKAWGAPDQTLSNGKEAWELADGNRLTAAYDRDDTLSSLGLQGDA